jgi:signal transduction histidine kinase
VHGAVRVTFPTADVDARIRRTWTGLLLVSGVVLAAATLLSLMLARTMTRPVTHLTDGTRRMAEGDAAVRIEPEGPPELRGLAQSFNIMAAGLSDLLASQEAFVADASHQLRSPLAALRLRLENLEDHLMPGGAEELRAAVTETMRLSHLVDGLLALTRADAVAASPEPVDLAAVVTERCQAWAALGEEEGVRIVAEVSGATVTTVAGTVEQVLDNLIANALAVAPVDSQITVTAARDGRDVVLHVLDEGPGLRGDARRRAFDRFWRGPTGGEGFGLGLAIVQRLVRNAGGTVLLQDAPSGGLDVVIRWPAASPAATADVSRPTA